MLLGQFWRADWRSCRLGERLHGLMEVTGIAHALVPQAERPAQAAERIGPDGRAVLGIADGTPESLDALVEVLDALAYLVTPDRTTLLAPRGLPVPIPEPGRMLPRRPAPHVA